MYIELFLLDNIVMNYLMLRIAGAICSVRIPLGRILLAAFAGALLAWIALFFPMLMASLPAKLLSGLLFAFAVPFKGIRGYMLSAGAMFISAFLTGGVAVCLSLALGGRLENGFMFASIPLRAALLSALAASLLPNAVRRLISRHAQSREGMEIHALIGGKEYKLQTLVDTGNLLREPLSGLPVAVAYLPELHAAAGIPVPASTVAGEGTLYALKPDRVWVSGSANVELPLLIALSKTPLHGADMILPAAVINYRGAQ